MALSGRRSTDALNRYDPAASLAGAMGKTPQGSKSWLARLVSPGALTIVILAMLTMSTVSAIWLIRSSQDLTRVAGFIEEMGTSQSHLATNEIFAVSEAALKADQEQWTRLELTRFLTATAVLKNRAEEMEQQIPLLEEQMSGQSTRLQQNLAELGRTSIRSIKDVVEIVERVQNISNIEAMVRTDDFQKAVDVARSDVFEFVDLIVRVKFDHGRRQTDSIRKLVGINLGLLGLFAFASVACLLLLRSEMRAGQLRDQAEDRARRLAYFDLITGLPNRARFTDLVEAALKSETPVALVLIDLDYFKDINDRFGHLAGDTVLREFADRIRTVAIHYSGVAARLGGDEFAVYLEDDDPSRLRRFCDRLQDTCREAIPIGDASISPSFSAGLAASTQLSRSRRAHMEELMRVSDFALYASKAAGRGTYTLYDADLEAEFASRRDLVSALPKAIESDALEVFFQPKIDLITGEPLNFEALVRWRHNDQLLAPDAFIQIAEETGMIIELDRYVLRQAVGLVADWNRTHRTNFGVSVNLSAIHFKNERDLDFVTGVLDYEEIPPEYLTLEITETVQLGNRTNVGAIVDSLRKLGCRISIDDFGAGFSSLAYLRMINADELKIDRELVREIESSDEAQFILDAVIELAEHLGLDVVVEGIETEEQLLRVREMGCRVGQGYLFAAPLPAKEALEWAMQRLYDDGSAAAG